MKVCVWVGGCVCLSDVHAVDMIIENKWCSIHNTLTQPIQLIRISLCTTLTHSVIHSHIETLETFIHREGFSGFGESEVERVCHWLVVIYFGYAIATESIEMGRMVIMCLIMLEQNHLI